MADPSLIGYCEPDCHDGAIVDWIQDADRVIVRMTAADGTSIEARFRGVVEVKSNQPEGMLLYALAEMRTQGPNRRFVFVPWDENDERVLEIVAEAQDDIGSG